MTIYIAICDDNIADRKHIERLLEREKDSRLKETGDVLYIESFGSSEPLLKTPVKYDMFIIDITSSENNGMDVAKQLRKRGIIAPITLLSSTIDYSSFGMTPGNTACHVKDQLTAGKLTHIVDIAKNWALEKPPLLEIRGKKDTIFIPHEDLIRATEKKNYVEVCIEGIAPVIVPGNMKNFLRVVNTYNCFIMCKKTLVNIHHIRDIEGNSMILSNDEKWSFAPYRMRQILEQFVSFTSSKGCGTLK